MRDRVRRPRRGAGDGRLRLLVGKPGLDGHSNGAEQIAVRARDAGFEVVYQGIRLTPEQIVAAAVAGGRATCVGLSVLSGSHLQRGAGRPGRAAGGRRGRPAGGGRRHHPRGRRRGAAAAGVARVFTPKDYSITATIGAVVQVIRAARGLDAATRAAAPAPG